MNTQSPHVKIPRLMALAAITGLAAIAGSIAHAQTADPLLMDPVDQEAFPQVIAQPVDQVIPLGSNAVLSVQAVYADNYQWQSNGIAIEGQTNSTLVIEKVGIQAAGSYSCTVSQTGGDAVPTRAASLSVAVTGSSAVATTTSSSLAAASSTVGGPITVFGMPKVSSGTQGDCPGHYAGYISYTRTISQGWGWAPSTNSTTVFTAVDGSGRTDTVVVYLGKNGDNDCNQTMVTIPNPPFSSKYRFSIYFPSNVPTTNYPIVLTGFDP